MATRDGAFKFNLLPPKPKEVVELELEREDSITYALVLIFIATIIYFGLVILSSLLIEPRLRAAQTGLDERVTQRSSFANVLGLHGELYIKTQTLKPVLQLDLNPTEIFRVSDALVAADPTLQIESYSREKGGIFVFQILAPAFMDVTKIAQAASEIEGVSDVFIRGAVLNSTRTNVRTTIALNIDAIQE
jgi:hypothetical protein